MPSPLISEIRYVTLAVRDLDIATTFYSSAIGWELLGLGDVSGPGYERAWQMPPLSTGRVRVLGLPGAVTALLRLVQFDQPGVGIRYEDRAEDPGIVATRILARDLESLWRRAEVLGARPRLPLAPALDDAPEQARDTQFFDPSGAIVEAVQAPAEGIVPALPGTVSDIQAVILVCHDAERSRDFYGHLGYAETARLDTTVRVAGPLEGRPLRRIRLAAGPGIPGGIDLVEFTGVTGRSLVERAMPPNHGYLSVSFETDDLDGTARMLSRAGASQICDPQTVEVPHLGLARIQAFRGPDGEVLEMLEAL